MKIVLLERVSNLGQMGDVVDVKSGYARNFLLPKKIGLRATQANIQIFESQKAELEAKNLESKAEAEMVKLKLEGKYFTLLRSASDSGALYGSVSSKDICKNAESEEVKISKNQIVLEKPIKELGIHSISISLHPEVVTEIFINVARTVEEAELQADGTVIIEKDLEKEQPKMAAETLFEDAKKSASLQSDEDHPKGSSDSLDSDEQVKNQE